MILRALMLVTALVLLSSLPATALILNLGEEEIVEAGGLPINVDAYSVPSLVDWNDDGLPDLLVGEGGGLFQGRVRVYLNDGAPAAPAFTDYFHVFAGGQELVVPGNGWMGAFPRVAYWDEDDRKDLLIGDTMGEIHLFRNIGTEAAPEFGADELLMVGPAGEKLAIDVGIRSAPLYQDWDADGRRDLIVGAWDGRIHLFINEGTDTAPDFITTAYAQTPAGDLVVEAIRSSPIFRDLDEDGLPDLLSGNTEGQILFYRNIGTEGAPLFDDYELVTAAGVPIDFESIPRSRPFLCDWSGDGYLDLLVGISDGGVHLFQGAPTAVASLPPAARLGLPWPNPANPRVDLVLQVERAGRMRVAVHDGAGRFVKTLFAGRAEAGSLDLRWDGRDEAGRELPSGLYLIHLRGAEAASARKVLLLR